MGRIHHFPGLTIMDANVKVDVNLERFSKQFQEAQKELDQNVMNSMQRFMPNVTGRFIDVTKKMNEPTSGLGLVFAGRPPMGRFLHYGMLMVDPVTKSPWARKGAKKVLTSTPLKYNHSKNPDAGANWYPRADKADKEKWIAQCKKTAGGGSQ